MAEYIVRENAINEFAIRSSFYDAEWGNKRFTPDDVEEILQSIPAADVVEVVRCKECVHHYYAVDCAGRCKLRIGDALLDEDYCSRAEAALAKEA